MRNSFRRLVIATSSRRHRGRVLAALAGFAVLTGGGIALAHAGTSQAAPTPQQQATLTLPNDHSPVASAAKHGAKKPGVGVSDLISAEAKVTGLTTTVITADLKAGQTLNAIAGTQAAAVVTAAEATLTAKVNAAVAAGKYTAAQGQTLITAAEARLTALMAEPGQQVLTPAKKSMAASPSPAPSPGV